MDTFSTPATKKNAALLKTLFGDPTQALNIWPPPRSFQRKPIQAQYPHEYPKLPTSKSNAWDDRQAKQKKNTATHNSNQQIQQAQAGPWAGFSNPAPIQQPLIHPQDPHTTCGDYWAPTPNDRI